MKFETTPAFDADYRTFKAEHRTTFRVAPAGAMDVNGFVNQTVRNKGDRIDTA